MFRQSVAMFVLSLTLIAAASASWAQVTIDVKSYTHFVTGAPAGYYHVDPGASADVSATTVSNGHLINNDTVTRPCILYITSDMRAYDYATLTTSYVDRAGFKNRPVQQIPPMGTEDIYLILDDTTSLGILDYDYVSHAWAQEINSGSNWASEPVDQIVQVSPYA